jgi:zinc protease
MRLIEIRNLSFFVLLFAAIGLIESPSVAMILVERVSDNATRTFLDNGMEVVLVNQHAAPVIAISITVKAGSHLEDEATSGVSHFLEHLLFNGTQNRTQQQIYDEMDEIGAYNNASTSEDYVNFIILASTEHIDKAMEIQSDMLFNSTFPAENFEKEKGIVVEEIAQNQARPDYLSQLYFLRTVFEGTAYALPVLGTPLSIQHLTREAVVDFYHRYYIPNNMILTAMGDFTVDEMLGKIGNWYGSSGSRPLAKEPAMAIPEISGKSYRFIKCDGKRSNLEMAFPAPAFGQNDFYAFQLLAEMLNSDSPLGLKNSLASRGQVFSLSCSMDYHPRFSRFSITVSHSTDLDGRDLVREISDGLLALNRKKISPSFVKGVLTGMVTENELNAERPHYYGMLASQNLAVGGTKLAANFLDSLKNIRSEQLAGALRQLAASPYLALGFAPETGKMPGEAIRDESGIVDKMIGNGLQIIVRQNRGSKIFALHLLAKNRSALEPSGKAGLADFLHHLLLRGAGGMNAEQFAGALEACGIRIQVADNPFIPYDDYYSSPEYSFIRLECLNEYRAEALKLFSAMMRSPRFDQKQFEMVKNEQLDSVQKEEASAAKKAKRLFWKQIANGEAIANPIVGTPESVQSLTLDDVRDFYTLYFAPENLIVSAIGNSAPEEIAALIESYLGGMTTVAGLKDKQQEFKLTHFAELNVITEELGNSQSAILMGNVLDNQLFQEQAAIMVANEILSSRIAFELREKQGLAYSIGSNVEFYGSQAVLTMSMGTRAQNLDKAREGLLQELQRLHIQPPDEKETSKAANQLQGRNLMRQLSSINRAYLLGLGTFKWDEHSHYEHLTQSLSKVTSDEVKNVIGKYMPLGNVVTVIVK